jgi:iron-sulfur cluster assembly protein
MAAVKLRLGEGENLLDRLLEQGVALAHECGGTLACATCRVIVREGLESLGEMSEDEQDMLDRASSFEPGARLACQAIGGDGDLVIEIPQDEALHIAAPLRGTARPILLTESAARHFAAQLAKRRGAVAVRLGVQPAGCSGYRYQVDHADAIGVEDVVFESNGIRIAVDPASLPHVQGTTLDVVQEGLSRRLRFDNPNASQTCGCGESFGTSY